MLPSTRWASVIRNLCPLLRDKMREKLGRLTSYENGDLSMDMQPKRQTLNKQEIHFLNGNRAQAVHSPIGTHATDIIHSLGIPQPGALIMIAGGASKMEKQIICALSSSFTYGIAQVAASLDALIIDGGTQSGVMELAGLAVAQQEHKPFLLGVAP